MPLIYPNLSQAYDGGGDSITSTSAAVISDTYPFLSKAEIPTNSEIVHLEITTSAKVGVKKVTFLCDSSNNAASSH